MLSFSKFFFWPVARIWSYLMIWYYLNQSSSLSYHLPLCPEHNSSRLSEDGVCFPHIFLKMLVIFWIRHRWIHRKYSYSIIILAQLRSCPDNFSLQSYYEPQICEMLSAVFLPSLPWISLNNCLIFYLVFQPFRSIFLKFCLTSPDCVNCSLNL